MKIKNYQIKVFKVIIAQRNHSQIALVIIDHNPRIRIIFAEDQRMSQNRYSRSNIHKNCTESINLNQSHGSNDSNYDRNCSSSIPRNSYYYNDHSRNYCFNRLENIQIIEIETTQIKITKLFY